METELSGLKINSSVIRNEDLITVVCRKKFSLGGSRFNQGEIQWKSERIKSFPVD